MTHSTFVVISNVADSPREGVFKVEIYSQNGTFLGETEITYIDLVEEALKQAVSDPSVMRLFLNAAIPCLKENSGRSSCDTANSSTIGRLMYI